MRRLFIFITAGVIANSTAQAQRRGVLSRDEVSDLQRALERGDALEVVKTVEGKCGSTRSQDVPRKPVRQRAAAARDALECVRMIGATAFASAPADRALQVREVFASLEANYSVEYRKELSNSEFLGLSWGLGLGFSISADENIDDADIVAGIVRVKSDTKQLPRAVFEFHKYFAHGEREDGVSWGLGPFVAAAATDEKVLSGVGLGAMLGFKAKEDKTEGFSLGVGAVLDSKVKDLGKGFAADAQPPAGETSVRFATRSRWSLLVFVTRTF